MEILKKPKFIGLLMIYAVITLFFLVGGEEKAMIWLIFSGLFIGIILLKSDKYKKQAFLEWLDK